MLHGLLAEMRAVGATDVVLEATSHALEQGRLDGCAFRVAAMTNLTQDHLDYHGDMERYFDAKAILFERLLEPGRGVAVTFIDDEAGRRMRARATGAGGRLGVARAPVRRPAARTWWSRRARSARTERGRRWRRRWGGSRSRRRWSASTTSRTWRWPSAWPWGAGSPPTPIVAGAARLAGVPGRLERVDNARGVLCVVDYAHTPDALERAIAAMRPLVAPGRRLIAVFGCGGDRDRGKRPLMGEIAAARTPTSRS